MQGQLSENLCNVEMIIPCSGVVNYILNKVVHRSLFLLPLAVIPSFIDQLRSTNQHKQVLIS